MTENEQKEQKQDEKEQIKYKKKGKVTAVTLTDEDKKEIEEFKVKLPLGEKGKKQQKRRLSQKEVAIALIECDGFLGKTAIKLGVHSSTLRKVINESDYLHELIEDITEATLDFAESYLKKQISYGNMTAIIYYLKCKGVSRGWREEIDAEKLKELTKPVVFEYTYVPPKEEKKEEE
jgi:hypothetical protein